MAMLAYGVALIPLIRDLKTLLSSNYTCSMQCTNDSSACRNLIKSCNQLEKLRETRSNHGHQLNCSKITIATNSKEADSSSKKAFNNLGITTYARGFRFLGDCARNKGLDNFLESKIKKFLSELKKQ